MQPIEPQDERIEIDEDDDEYDPEDAAENRREDPGFSRKNSPVHRINTIEYGGDRGMSLRTNNATELMSDEELQANYQAVPLLFNQNKIMLGQNSLQNHQTINDEDKEASRGRNIDLNELNSLLA